ncbi:hypothetical protein [Flectobacillus roseus]|uniref:Uncharacterized protein n=1 Tax=Flectobacillus roseus TaxID=502259 RepID=A0ABT6YB50_9BACT|nr:hypothetical protein [Flectobacillus roseus]MDI9860804.1 hypothetical protein [Flectobacillus roseus]
MLQKFWLKLALIISVPLLALSLMAYMVDSGLRKSNHTVLADWNALFNAKINADLLVLGSSRAAFHISPYILDSTLHLNSYNLGMSAWRFDMQWTRFKLYLEHNKAPKYVVHNVDLYGFAKRKNLVDYQQFLPYLNEPLLIKNLTDIKGEFNHFQKYMPMYKYANDLDLAWEGFKCYAGSKNVAHTDKYKGFKGNDIPWDNQFEKFKKKYPKGINYTIESDVKASFEEYLRFCQKKGIKVILVYAPEYYEVQPFYKNKKAFNTLCQNAVNKYGCIFLDYTNDSLCFEKKWFYNSQHLNKKGAEVFSAKLAEDLKKIGVGR